MDIRVALKIVFEEKKLDFSHLILLYFVSKDCCKFWLTLDKFSGILL